MTDACNLLWQPCKLFNADSTELSKVCLNVAEQQHWVSRLGVCACVKRFLLHTARHTLKLLTNDIKPCLASSMAPSPAKVSFSAKMVFRDEKSGLRTCSAKAQMGSA